MSIIGDIFNISDEMFLVFAEKKIFYLISFWKSKETRPLPLQNYSYPLNTFLDSELMGIILACNGYKMV